MNSKPILCLALALGGVLFGCFWSKGQADTGAALSKSDIQALTEYAELGSVEAQARLGLAYMGGNGVPQDQTNAFYWFQKAAQQGDERAETGLAAEYATGLGTARNDQLAFEWYQKAARQGMAVAQDELGIFYAKGIVAKKDLVEAYKWFNLASEEGDESATEHMAAVAPSLTPDQIYEGYRRAQAFVPVKQVYTNNVAWNGEGFNSNTVQGAFSYFASVVTNRMGPNAGPMAAQWLAETETNVQTVVTNSGWKETYAAGDFLTEIKKAGRLPGIAKDVHGNASTANQPLSAYEAAAYPFAVTFNVVANGDTLTNHYTVLRPAPNAPWQLEKAWRTDTQGKTIEEWPVQ